MMEKNWLLGEVLMSPGLKSYFGVCWKNKMEFSMEKLYFINMLDRNLRVGTLTYMLALQIT